MDSNKAAMGTANLDAFANTLIELAANDRDILVATSDSRGSGKVTPFGEKYPDQMVEIGIAEQNLVGVSADWHPWGKRFLSSHLPVS
jgi:transketolase